MSLGPRSHGRQGILPFVIELGERDDVTARAGLPLVVETMRALGVDDLAQAELPEPKRRRGFTPAQKLEALVTLLAAGGDRVEDIRVLSEDQGLERLLGGPLPSPDALLDFLGQFHDPACWAHRPPDKQAYVPPESLGLRALETINRDLVARGAARTTTRATIDHDGTIIESHKRDAKLAYEGTRGYQPLVAVWAEEQLIVADEFRDGNVAGGEDPLSSAQRAMENLPPWVRERYFRGDSASYYAPLLKHLVGEGIGFTISADLTKELRACCLAVPHERWVELENRGSEQVDVAELEFTPGDWPKHALPLRYVAVRFTPLQAELFDTMTPKHLAIVSNRAEADAGALVRWHWEKAGTIEHVHRVMKDELGAGVMPSGRFGANAAWFRINALTFNVLTVLKRRALPERWRDARPKRLRFELFTLPGKLTVHQSRLSVRTSAREERLREVVDARGRLLAMLQARRAG
ncbi:MAG: IS1380 family transposase [Candidatus Eisenbacteria bacterium]|nr:IS1380 family transposase [Candidatus Eisenbacteria bacterium]